MRKLHPAAQPEPSCGSSGAVFPAALPEPFSCGSFGAVFLRLFRSRSLAHNSRSFSAAVRVLTAGAPRGVAPRNTSYAPTPFAAMQLLEAGVAPKYLQLRASLMRKNTSGTQSQGWAIMNHDSRLKSTRLSTQES